MSEHYYTAVPVSKSVPRQVESVYRGENISFVTDNGVFSKHEVDAGSQILMEALPEDMTGELLDIGCGWGAICVSVGKKYPALSITGCDVNERALALARTNAEKNRVTARFILSDGLANVDGLYDIIVTNPPIRAGKQVIYRLFAEASAQLRKDGALYIVIRKQQGAPSAIKYLETLFGSVRCIEKSAGYWVLACNNTINSLEGDKE